MFFISGCSNSNSDVSSEPGSNTSVSKTYAVPNVYMTNDISPNGLMAVYKALGSEPTGRVGVKVNFGEVGDTYYVNPSLIEGLVKQVNGTFVECNTVNAGIGQRSNTAMHLQVAKDHGFTGVANVDIMDSEGSISLPVKGAEHLKEIPVGSHLKNYDSLIVLSHFKGHDMAGFGGAIKNLSVGVASTDGKMIIHCAGANRPSLTKLFITKPKDFEESMAEASKAIADYKGNHILYINIMNNLSIDCDCSPSPAAPTMKDIGILASLDPVALDKACVDLVNAAPDGKDLQKRIKSKDGVHLLDYAQKIGLGSETYKLVRIND
jgi:uncharacterized Fe-S center protein